MREDIVLSFIEEYAPIPSGRDKRYFTGTLEAAYATYEKYVENKDDLNELKPSQRVPVCPSTFKRLIKREHIGFRKGTAFDFNEDQLLESLNSRLSEINESMGLEDPSEVTSWSVG